MLPSSSPSPSPSSSRASPRMKIQTGKQIPLEAHFSMSPSPTSPRLILNSPPLDHPHSQSHHDSKSYFQQHNKRIPKPLYPPGQGGSNMASYDPPSPTSDLPQPSSSTSNRKYSMPIAITGKGRTPAEMYANEHTKQQNNNHHHVNGNNIVTSNITSNLPLNSKRHINDNSPLKDKSLPHQQAQNQNQNGKTAKPIFDWISRKLGSRRATISESPFSSTNSTSNVNNRNYPNNGGGSGGSPKLGNSRNRLPSMPKPNTSAKIGHGPVVPEGKGFAGGRDNHVGVRGGNGLNMRRENSAISENQSISMLSMSTGTRSFVGTIERERRREANNPYPSIPIPKLMAANNLRDTIRKERGRSKRNNNNNGRNGIEFDGSNNIGNQDDDGQTNDTFSMSISYSYLSRSPRSRSYSLDSIRSSISNSRTKSLDDLNDNSSERGLGLGPRSGRSRRFRGRASTAGTSDRPSSSLGVNPIFGGGLALVGGGGGADDDASLRPFPPSHPASPTPSTSVLSRTGSNPIPANTATSIKLDAHGNGGRSRTNTFYSTWSGAGHNRSFTSSSLDGLYGSTYRYSYDRRDIPNDDDDDEEENEENDDDDGDEERGRQSRQDSTSTKPTTCISFDSTPAIAHIAQPQSQISTAPQPPQIHIQTQTQGAVATINQSQTPTATQHGTFDLGGIITWSPASSVASAVDRSDQMVDRPNDRPSSQSSSPDDVPIERPPQIAAAFISSPTSPTPTTPTSITAPPSPPSPIVHVQAPKHTPHHPLHNPIPTEIPDDNASMLTLASSTFGLLPNQHTGQSAAHQMQNGTDGQNQPIRIPTEPPSTAQPTTSSSNDDSEAVTPQLPTSQIVQPQNDKVLPNDPPSIHRLRDTSSSMIPLRPSSITSPSIHWAPTPTPLEERPISNYENTFGYVYNYNYPPSINHAPTTTTSIISKSGGGWNYRDREKVDRDASVRAIRRKGSWESYESGWSWRGNNLNSDGWANQNQTQPKNLASPIGIFQQNENNEKLEGRAASFRGSTGGGGGYRTESWKSRNEDYDADEIQKDGGGGERERIAGLAVVAN